MQLNMISINSFENAFFRIKLRSFNAKVTDLQQQQQKYVKSTFSSNCELSR